jgi:SecD/SecF fusion protein
LTINTSNRYAARNILNGIKNYAFPLPVKPITTKGYEPSSINTDCILNNASANTNEIKQVFSKTVLGLSPIVGLIISLCLIILGIGIIVSILYRVPGIFGIVTMLGAFGLTLMIMILSNYVVSLGLFLGLLVGILGATLSIFG